MPDPIRDAKIRAKGPCNRCKTGPRDSSNPCYCKPCQQEIGREQRARMAKKPQMQCSRCGGIRDGAHLSYCVACNNLYRAEQRVRPCIDCGSTAERGHSSYCYPCWFDRWLRRQFGISLVEFLALLDGQGGRCGICPRVPPEDLGTKPLGPGEWCVDHDHATGRNRGILCGPCNRGLGMFKDDPARLRRAAGYLEAHASV